MTKLEMLVEMYALNRQQGHTTAMLKGAEATKAVIIVADSRQAQNLWKNMTTHQNVVPLSEMDRLRGYRGPILIDHYALQVAFWDHQEEMKKKLLEDS